MVETESVTDDFVKILLDVLLEGGIAAPGFKGICDNGDDPFFNSYPLACCRNKAIFCNSFEKRNPGVKTVIDVRLLVGKVGEGIKMHTKVFIGFDNFDFKVTEVFVSRAVSVEIEVFVPEAVGFPRYTNVYWDNFVFIEA